jgi:hypothetical protein
MACASVFVSFVISAKENLGFGMAPISAKFRQTETHVQ